MKIIKALSLCCMMLFNAGLTALAQDQNFHIYLCFGQSNMEGMGTIEAQDRVTNTRVKVLQDETCSNLGRTYGQWYTAAPPLNRCWSKVGPGDNFGKVMAAGKPSNVTIGLVPASISGSDIALFQKGAPIGNGTWTIPNKFVGGYAWLLDLAKIAQKTGVIKGIIFHQGETNTNNTAWKTKVQGIVADLRKDLGIGNVPFLAGELLYSQNGGCCSSHNTEVNKLPGLIPNSAVISASGLAGADVAHFTTAAYRELGKRYADKMLAMEKVTSTQEKENGQGFNLFPSPCTDKLSVSLASNNFDEKVKINIFSLDGQSLLEQTFNSTEDIVLNIERLQPNMYVLKMDTETSSWRSKFVKAE